MASAPPPAPRLLRARAAAAYLGLSYDSLLELRKRGVLPVVEVPGLRALLFDRAALDRAIVAWTEPGR